MKTSLRRCLPLSSFLWLAACGGEEEVPKDPPSCEPASEQGCEAGQVCEEVEGGAPACFAPVVVSGKVFDTSNDAAVEGAHVVARDANGSAVSTVAVTDANGSYRLSVPARRAANGSVVSQDVTLRADASGYLGFPRAPRVALPVDLADVTVSSALTEIGLIPLADSEGLGTISGRVGGEHPAGTLVVADATDALGVTGIADVNGDYTVFNVPAGSVAVNGYARGVNLDNAELTLEAGAHLTGVDLAVLSTDTATVGGNVQIVNAPGGAATSVILVVESTFDEVLLRGDVPPGLRAGDVSGTFSILGVPDGRYVALAAFENDALVRDPDTSIGGTELVHVEVTGGADRMLAEGFKVTEALEVNAPGAEEPELVSQAPELSWADDSSEDSYDLEVFDALGNVVWERSGIVGPKGSQPVVVTYEGPLERGMFYQFRAISIKDGTPISATEDLRGVFTLE
ncbi:MAG TPA: hypothetical protein VGK73_20970 [Polyangiaceae bacterium]